MRKLLFITSLASFMASCSKPENTIGEKVKAVSTDTEAQKKTQGTTLVKFWQLVAQQKVAAATSLANSLKLGISNHTHDYYKNLFEQESVSFNVVSRKDFNDVDAFFWLQAQLMKRIAVDIKQTSQAENLISHIFAQVKKRVQPSGDGKDIGAYPFHIWQRGFGVCDRQAWVFCEISYQLGANTSVIYLIDPLKEQALHTICEVEYEGRHYIVDTLYNVFLPDTTLTDLSDEIVKKNWSDRPELFGTFKKAVRQIPAMPTDYSDRNQRLSAYLGGAVKFGEPPQNRYHFWKKISPEVDTRFWNYPIRLLKTFSVYQNAEK